ncbi:hypothetical protein FOMG_15695 [Fusarium oxysporum f. sp. melonis 26406]|uniref:Uncharacterized protein n=1 Tax=Fusarium oxysporum f. sp. melonis 26406 TaxID=1089452 RepID=W9ZGY3_FUSOX|nr:hypothetical protein FOMG_15695 [Fusarium oxysporum f. sp. melonis 26406]KAJ9424280.1 hypothetical protein QL093DRAFT_2098233 [Fusarium oxysporum]
MSSSRVPEDSSHQSQRTHIQFKPTTPGYFSPALQLALQASPFIPTQKLPRFNHLSRFHIPPSLCLYEEACNHGPGEPYLAAPKAAPSTQVRISRSLPPAAETR